MFRTVNRSLPCTVLTLVVSSVVLMFPAMARGGPTDLKIGIAAAKITPARPIRMAGYASRKKPSEGVLLDLYAKAMVFEDNQGERGLLITADVIGFNAKVADFLCESIAQETGLERRQIMLNPSNTSLAAWPPPLTLNDIRCPYRFTFSPYISSYSESTSTRYFLASS